MQSLIGQKVWVIQFDDEDTSVIGIVDANLAKGIRGVVDAVGA